MHRIIALGLILGLSLSTTTIAERTLRVLYLGEASNAPSSLVLFDGKNSQEIELPTMNLSPVYKLPKGELMLQLLDKPPETPEEIPEGTPKAKVSEQTGDIYLLITGDPKNKVLPVSMQIINADLGSFRKGQLLWFNLTTSRVGGQLGSEKLALEPKSRKISNSPAQGAENYPVELYYQKPGEDKARPLCETKWQHNPSGRIIMFVLNKDGSRKPKVMGFPDFRVEEEKDEKQGNNG